MTLVENEMRALEAALESMRDVRDEIDGLHAGVAILHLDAAIASLESHLRRLPAARAARS